MKFQISNLEFQRNRRSGFTMVEIALCLAIIGFALVAIIGVLPTGLNVQRNNREETIIDQDAAVWMNTLRDGSQGFDDLTNYVIAITNYAWYYQTGDGTASLQGPERVDVFTPQAWYRNGQVQGNPTFLLDSGMHIVGLLSKPRILWTDTDHYWSNYTIANVRAMSGSAADKSPQTNSTLLDSAFSYRMIVQVGSYVPFDTNAIQASPYTDYRAFDPTLPDISVVTTNSFWNTVKANRRILGAACTNSHDLRLTFRWPLLPNGTPGPGRQTFRLFTTGELYETNDPSQYVADIPLYFLKPSTYVQAQ